MSVSSRKEIRDHVMSIADVSGDSIETLTNNFINDTLREINDPGWAFAPRKEVHHLWTFLRRTEPFDTVASQADYVLDRQVDKIAGIKFDNKDPLIEVDLDSWTQISDKTNSGNPFIYFPWAVSGLSTVLSVADTIDIVSSSTSDSGDSNLTVTVWGRVSGVMRSETYQLNGTTKVSGTLTFDAGEVFISKQKASTGSITATENSGSTTLLVMGPNDSNLVFKVITLYKVPNSVLEGDIYYYDRIRELENDSDVPQFDRKWHHIVTKGTLAKIYEHLGKTEEKNSMVAFYRSAVRSMIVSDQTTPNFIPKLKRHNKTGSMGVKRSEDDIS